MVLIAFLALIYTMKRRLFY